MDQQNKYTSWEMFDSLFTFVSNISCPLCILARNLNTLQIAENREKYINTICQEGNNIIIILSRRKFWDRMESNAQLV